jgi:hypothetical protein
VDVAALRARFRVAGRIDIAFEAVGTHASIDHTAADDRRDRCVGGCGSRGCDPKACADTANPSSTSPHPCGSCGFSRFIADRRRGESRT